MSRSWTNPSGQGNKTCPLVGPGYVPQMSLGLGLEFSSPGPWNTRRKWLFPSRNTRMMLPEERIDARQAKPTQTKQKKQVFKNKTWFIRIWAQVGSPWYIHMEILPVSLQAHEELELMRGKLSWNMFFLFLPIYLSYLHFWIFSDWGNVTLWNTFLILFLIQKVAYFYRSSFRSAVVIVFILGVSKGEL